MSIWSKITGFASKDSGKSYDFSRYAVIDVEVGLQDHKIHDIGALRYDDAIFHKASKKEFLTFINKVDYLCGLIKSLKENGFPVIYGLTNWSAETFPPVREKYEIFSLIDHIVCSGEEKLLKPDPKIYQTLLERYNLKAEESVFIDDNINNVKGAIDMGMKSIRFVNAEQLQKDLNELLNK